MQSFSPLTKVEEHWQTIDVASSSAQRAVRRSSEAITEQVRVLKAVADPIRLQLLHLIKQREGTVCVEEIVTCFSPLAQPTISHHLRILRDARLIEFSKQGLYSYYYLRPERLEQVGLLDAVFHPSFQELLYSEQSVERMPLS